MNTSDRYMLNLQPEVKDTAATTLALLKQLEAKSKVWFVTLRFYDEGDARAAKDALSQFARNRGDLKFRKNINSSAYSLVKADEKSSPEYIHQRGEAVYLPFDDYIPAECCELLDVIHHTRAEMLPVSRSLVKSITSFVSTYRSLIIIRASVSTYGYSAVLKKAIDLLEASRKPYGEYDLKDYYAHNKEYFDPPSIDVLLDIHQNLLSVGSIVEQVGAATSPVVVVISGNAKNIDIAVDGQPLRLSRSKICGVLALSLLKYDEWFEAKAFCEIAFPLEKPYNARGQFDAALRDMKKKHPPFSWDADDKGNRRITGAIVKLRTDKQTVREFLHQKE